MPGVVSTGVLDPGGLSGRRARAHGLSRRAELVCGSVIGLLIAAAAIGTGAPASAVPVPRAPGGAVSAAGRAPTFTGLTLLSESLKLYDSNNANLPGPSRTYVSPNQGWKFSYDLGPGQFFASIVAGAQDNYYFGVHAIPKSLVAGNRVTTILGYGGTECNDDVKNGIVRDIRRTSSGVVTRLDVVFAIPCTFDELSGFVSGEMQYNEPVSTTVRSQPSELLWPPTALNVSRRTYAIREYAASGSQGIAAMRITGAARRYFRVTNDGCSGHVITTSKFCTVWVRYWPHSSEDLANLDVLGAGGATLTRTLLDAAAIPGTTYWAATTPEQPPLTCKHP